MIDSLANDVRTYNVIDALFYFISAGPQNCKYSGIDYNRVNMSKLPTSSVHWRCLSGRSKRYLHNIGSYRDLEKVQCDNCPFFKLKKTVYLCNTHFERLGSICTLRMVMKQFRFVFGA